MEPVTGPVVKTDYLVFGNGYEQFYRYYRRTVSYKQKPPFSLRLSYQQTLGRVWNTDLSRSPYSSADSVLAHSVRTDVRDGATNKAYAKFVDEVRREANLMVSLLEYRSTAAMLEKRVVQLARFARELSRLRFRKAIEVLRGSFAGYGMSVRAMRDKWKKDKSLAGLWLEFHFGWQPLLRDIFSCLEVLSGNIRSKTVRSRATEVLTDDWVYQDPWGTRRVHRNTEKLSCQMIADMRVTSPNLRNLTELGVTNPALWVWEKIPFSFVVDWFANVSQVLGSFDDFLGLELTNAATTYKHECVRSWDYSDAYGVAYASGGTFSGFERTGGIATPRLRLAPFRGLSVARGLTAISLLVQFLPRK